MESVLLFSLMSVCLADSHMLGDPWSLSGGLDESAVEHSWSLINQMKYQHVDNELHGEQPKGEGLKCVGFIHRISQNNQVCLGPQSRLKKHLMSTLLSA